jgi:hypothetical protein
MKYVTRAKTENDRSLVTVPSLGQGNLILQKKVGFGGLKGSNNVQKI